ncbi:sodium-coupled monocarboxylate transporter 1-like isoform X1 [Haemaphysalis longicornis]
MAAPPLHVSDYIVLGLLSALGIAAGLYISFSRRRNRHGVAPVPSDGARDVEQEEAFLGSRRLYAIPLSVSLFASALTSTSLVSFPAHYYAYGMHAIWCLVSIAVVTPIVAHTFVPVLYNLHLTSVFEYLRMRYSNGVGVTACVIYFLLSEVSGGLGIYCCALALSTMLGAPFMVWNMVIGIVGTTYTVLGGLRGVVWADTIQGLIMFASPVTILAKVGYDARYGHDGIQRRPVRDFDFSKFLFETELSASNDETIWASIINFFPFFFVRVGIDQMIAQRFLAARSLQDAQRVAYTGPALTGLYVILVLFMSLSLVYWYRDCDPLLAGFIARYDQIVPHYISENLSGQFGVRGLFLAGVVGATTSTVSSIINSHAAMLCVDVVKPYFNVSKQRMSFLIPILAITSGSIMTILATLMPYLGAAARVTIVLCGSISGPLSGLFLLALWIPWSNTKGAASATLVALVLQLWHSVGRSLAGVQPPRMDVSLDRCPYNVTDISPGHFLNDRSEAFWFYRIGTCWMNLFCILFTVGAGLAVSLATGGRKDVKKKIALSSQPIVRFWARVGLISSPLVIPETPRTPEAKGAKALLCNGTEEIGMDAVLDKEKNMPFKRPYC